MSTTRGLITAAVATAMAMALVPAAGGVAQARAKSWHIIGTTAVENARLSEDAFKSVDPSINTVLYRPGGEGNIEVCGFVPHPRKSPHPVRHGGTPVVARGRR